MPSHVCKLHKPLYGLEQATRAWFDKLFQAFKYFGFTQSSFDAFLFVLKALVLVIVLDYMDDTLISGPNPTICKQFIHKLSTLFPVNDLGPPHYFLGLEVQRSKDDLFLHQSKYLLNLLQRQVWRVQNLVVHLLVLSNWITVALLWKTPLSTYQL